MKPIKQIVLLFLLPVQSMLAQEPVTLDQCQQWARENHPVLQQKGLYQQIAELKKVNDATAYLPQVNLNGQATYQSDVTKIGLSLPNVNIKPVDKDQYKFYFDLKQMIWDGGVSQAKALVDQAENESNQQQVDVDLYQIKDRINQFFFTSFLIQENLKILEKKTETLSERRKLLESGVKNGMVIEAELDQLIAEQLKTGQDMLDLETNRQTVLAAMAILTGKTMQTFENLQLTESLLSVDTPTDRPELKLFERQNEQLSVSSDLLRKQRNPKLYGFGQAGYGRPGLNMLNTKFDTYYLVGLGFSWNVFDWKNVKRQQEQLRLQQQLIDTRRQDFVRNIDVATDQQKRQIELLEQTLKRDRELIAVRERITRSSSSKLENGAITTADYIQDLNAEITARLTFETHKIKLEEAKVNFRTIKGNQ